MSDTNDTVVTVTETPAVTRKGRPAGKSNKKERRNFAGELAALQGNVQTTCKLLKRAIINSPPSADLVLAALDVLGVSETKE